MDRPDSVSVIEPISPAIDRVKLILFEPFDLGKWFIIGFCAWLAYLGQMNGGGPNGGGGTGNRYSSGNGDELKEAFYEAREFVVENLSWIVPVVVFVIILAIVIWLVVTWLSSRGKFMFLHCIAHNKAEVKMPWSKYRVHAKSLFIFRIVLTLIGFPAVLVPLGFMAVFIGIMVSAKAAAVGIVLGFVFSVICVFIVSICLGLIAKFTEDFVVPIMFLHTTSIRVAWRQFLSILEINKARFFLYVLFQIVIGIAIGIIVMIGMCCTCCFCCLALIPYINTVLFLPILIFQRSYSLCYLRQYGRQFDVFSIEIKPELPDNSIN